MKKFLSKIILWWHLRVRNTTIAKEEVGGFVFHFRKYWLDIKGISGCWSMRLRGDMYSHGYLLAAQQKGMKEQLHGFAALLFLVADAVTQDQAFVNDLAKVIEKRSKRLEKQAAEKAKEEVSEQQEAADAALMQEVAREADMKPAARRKARKENKEVVKEVIKEGENADKKGNN